MTFYSKIIKNNLIAVSLNKTANTHLIADNILYSKDIRGPDSGQGEFRWILVVYTNAFGFLSLGLHGT